MIMLRRIASVSAALILAVAAHACALTHNRGPGAMEGPSTLSPPTRPGHERGMPGPRDAFLRNPPSCVVLLPAEATGRGAVGAHLVEAAVERFLAVRFDRLVSGARRDRMARHLALDLRRPSDLRVLANHARCDHALEVRVDVGALAYAVVWAERRVTLSLTLRRIGGDAEILWSAKAVGARGDVGLPVSPLGLLSALFRAGRVAGDKDQARSLLDDVLREMTAGLPDVRGLARAAPRGAADRI